MNMENSKSKSVTITLSINDLKFSVVGSTVYFSVYTVLFSVHKLLPFYKNNSLFLTTQQVFSIPFELHSVILQVEQIFHLVSSFTCSHMSDDKNSGLITVNIFIYGLQCIV
jgi:hypothetical protein